MLIGLGSLVLGVAIVWALTTDVEEATTGGTPPPGIGGPGVPAAVTSPAPQSASECKSIPLVRAEFESAGSLPENLGPYIPTFMPAGAALFGTWRETLAEHGPGAVWVTEDCRTLKLTLVETKHPREGEWKAWMSRRCTVASIGRTDCIDISADVPGTHLNLTTTGFSESVAMRVARSIDL